MEKAEAYRHFNADPTKPVVLLMPGSRKQEILSLLPDMLGAAEKIVTKIPDCQIFLPVASTISREMLHNILDNYKVSVKLTEGNNYDLMNIADVGIAASGTVTLEAALMNLPTVIVYRVVPMTYFLGKFLVKIPHISLPNIIAGREIVPELLQGEVNPDKIARYTLEILLNKGMRDQILTDLSEVNNKLGECGAVRRVADVILSIAAKGPGGN
ncbi:Lipid-A-disaccharide synthase [bioreactor metagenome]|uniref:lipid-A-disaccharide synthase n=1 Tax=bioreactor metagenome TaxID=1076179 RepID=A0A645FTM7_9ZZZZ